MAGPIATSDLAVPKPTGAVVAAMVMAAFLLFFIFLGLYNLFNRIAIVPSSLWLLLVAGVLTGCCKEKGLRQFAVNLLGVFSLKEFVRTQCREKGPNDIQFGYQVFGHRFLYLRISVDKIAEVHWHTGQATDMAGRDMNDWSVAVWYDHGDPVKSQKRQKLNRGFPDQEVYIVGPAGEKQKTTVFGLALLNFLRNSGATLEQGKDECTFVRNPPLRQGIP